MKLKKIINKLTIRKKLKFTKVKMYKQFILHYDEFIKHPFVTFLRYFWNENKKVNTLQIVYRLFVKEKIKKIQLITMSNADLDIVTVEYLRKKYH